VLVAAAIILSGAAALAHRAYNDVRVSESIAALPALAELAREVGAEYGGAYPEDSLLLEIFAVPTSTRRPGGSKDGRMPPHGLHLDIAAGATADSDYQLTHRISGRTAPVHIDGATPLATANLGLSGWFYISYTNLRLEDCLYLLLESPHNSRSGLLGILVSEEYDRTDLLTATQNMFLTRSLDDPARRLTVAAQNARFLAPYLAAAGTRGDSHFGAGVEQILPVLPATADKVCAGDEAGLTITWAFK
jgi:hypothetical protein